MFELQSGGFSTPSGWSAFSDRQESCCTFWCQYHVVSRIVERVVAAIERLASEVYGLTCAGPRLMDRVQRGFLMSKQEAQRRTQQSNSARQRLQLKSGCSTWRQQLFLGARATPDSTV